jgi:hypothetical protein
MAVEARPWHPARPPASRAAPPLTARLRRGRSSRGARLWRATPPWLARSSPSRPHHGLGCAGPPWLLARGRGPAAASARCAAPPGSAACSCGSPAWLARGSARLARVACPRQRLERSARVARPQRRGVERPLASQLACGSPRGLLVAACAARGSPSATCSQQRSAASFARSRSLFVRARSSAPHGCP